MERFFTPITTELPAADRVLVLAPHADDEVFGCGGLITRLARQGAHVAVRILTRPDDASLAQQRLSESCQAAALLGYPSPVMWELQDGALPELAAVSRWLKDEIERCTPDLILAPSPWEMHRDHRRVGEAALQACMQASLPPDAALLFYEVGQPLTPNMLVDITTVGEEKARAMQCFASQQALQDYSRHIKALNAYRTYSLPHEVHAAEAFLRVPVAQLADFQQVMTPQRLSAVVWHAESEVARFRRENTKLTADMAELKRSCQVLENDLKASNDAHAATRHQLEALAADNRLMRHSRSWRLTRPLRFGTALLKSPRSAARRLANRLPASLRTPLHSAYHRLMRRAELLWTSASQQSAQQAMGDRRLAQLAQGNHPPVPGLAVQTLPLVSLSVVTFNSERWLDSLLKSLEAQDYPLEHLELFFTDNGSRDGTLQILTDFQTRTGHRFHRLAVDQLDNPGFGAAHNHAASQASGDYLLITNPDLEFEPDTLHQVVGIAQQDSEEVASWELRQAPFEHPKLYDPVTLETLWSSHACILIRRSVFDALGGYDERIFLYGEDVEFSFRCREAGYLLRYCPGAMVQHHTYEEANQVKPSQYLGSTRANLFLRLRYGRRQDITAGALMALAGLLRGPFPGARRRLLAEYLGLLRQIPALLRENRSRSTRDIGVFRGFDYAMVRHGAFVPVRRPPAAEQAPLISVITRTYQGRDWLLRQAGFSVLQQTWPNIEWIVVEDGGEYCRETVTAFSRLTSHEVRYASQPKLGRSAAGNLGLGMARGRWCVFLDDDDLLYADHLETLANKLLDAPSLSAAYALAWDVSCEVDHNARRIKEETYIQQSAHLQEFDPAELAWRNYIPIQAILFERRLFEERGGFNEQLDQLEDWNLWRRYACRERFALVPRTTSLFRTPARQEHNSARQALLDEAYQRVKTETDAELKVLETRLAHD